MTHATVTLHMLWIIFKKETLQNNETFKKDILVQMLLSSSKTIEFSVYRTAYALCWGKKKLHMLSFNKMFQMVHATPKRAYLLKIQNFTIHNYMP